MSLATTAISFATKLASSQFDLAMKQLELKFETLRRQGAQVATSTILNAIRNSDTAKDLLSQPNVHALAFLTKFGFISVPQAVETAIKLKTWEVHRKAVQAELEEKLTRAELVKRQLETEALRQKGLQQQLQDRELAKIDNAFALIQKPIEIRLQAEMQQLQSFTGKARAQAGLADPEAAIRRLTRVHALVSLLNILAKEAYLKSNGQLTPTQAVTQVLKNLPADQLEDYGIDMESIALFKKTTGIGSEDTYGKIMQIYDAVQNETDPEKKLAMQDYISTFSLSSIIRSKIADLYTTLRSTTLDEIDKLATEGGQE